MPSLKKRVCDHCKREYLGTGTKYCSRKCAREALNQTTYEKLQTLDNLAVKLDHFFEIEGDMIVSSDWHLPLIDVDMVMKLIMVAKKFNLKKMALVGDFINFETIAHWDQENMDIDLRMELESAEELMDLLFDWFDEIYWCFGNHDDRLTRLFNFQLQPTEFGKLISDQIGKKLFISSHPYMILNNGTKWRLTHPKNYSILTNRVPTRLADKYRCNVLGAHGHHQGINFDTSGTDLCGDLGCLTDYQKTHYIMFKDTTHPIWNMGFGMIKNGTYYMFSANHNATDWDFWLDKDFLAQEGLVLNEEEKIVPIKNTTIKKVVKKAPVKPKVKEKTVGIVRTEASIRRTMAMDSIKKKKKK